MHQRRGRQDRRRAAQGAQGDGAAGRVSGVLRNLQVGQRIGGERIHLDRVTMTVHHATGMAGGAPGVEKLNVVTRSGQPGGGAVGVEQFVVGERTMEQG